MSLKWLSRPPRGPWEALGQLITGSALGLVVIVLIIGLMQVLG